MDFTIRVHGALAGNLKGREMEDIVSKFSKEYDRLLNRYIDQRSNLAEVKEIQHEAEELTSQIEDSLSTCDEVHKLRLVTSIWTCLKFAATCARRTGALDESVNLYRAAMVHFPEIETRVSLVLVLCESKRWAEACLLLNSIDDDLVINRMPEAAAELLGWICSETVLACGVSERVLRLCVLTVNPRSPVKIVLSGVKKG